MAHLLNQPMEWKNVEDCLPGTGVDPNKILVVLSNVEVLKLGKNNILGPWLSKDKTQEVYVTHWMEIAAPDDLVWEGLA